MKESFWSHISSWFVYVEAKPLIFTEGAFWLFFAILLLGYSFVYRTRLLRTSYLLLFSLFFYYKSSGYFFVLLLFSTLCDYILGLLIGASGINWKRKLYVAISVIINLLVLGFFKYSYFFIDLINSIFGTNLVVFNFLAHWFNAVAEQSLDVGLIVLPVGISFYTFQTISYTVDVYRRRVEPVRNIVDFAFYVSFFPQLVAGPIVRAAEFIPQLYRKFSLTKREFGHALFLILAGMIKKVVISDYISINFVDRVFQSPLSYSGVENLMAVYGYAVQIYCDFSGYTDIAIGLALILGFRLPINFNSPYKAVSITDFWRRWHISLSSWLRDYLYIPLGGNRKGSIRTFANLLVTMLLGGLWHGASLRFIIWGGMHGLSLAIHKLWFMLFPRKTDSLPLWRRMLGVLFTFHLVSFLWIFFRAESMEIVGQMLGQIGARFGWELLPQIISAYAPVFMLIAIAMLLHWLPVTWKEYVRGRFIDTHIAVKVLLTIIVAIIILQLKSADIQPFIYFRF